MEQTYEEYVQWLMEPVPGHIKHSYQKALDKLKKYIPYEDKLVSGQLVIMCERVHKFCRNICKYHYKGMQNQHT